MSDFDQKNGSHSQNNQQNQASGSYEADSTGQGPYPSYTKKGQEQGVDGSPNREQRPSHNRPSEPVKRYDPHDLVRKRRDRMTHHKQKANTFQTPIPKKIAIIACAFTFVVVGYWFFKSDSDHVDENELPVLTASHDTSEETLDGFKEAPSQEDIIAAPHSDKEFYGELDQSQKQSEKDTKTLRSLPERPSQQVSQESLFADNEATSSDTTIEKDSSEKDVVQFTDEDFTESSTDEAQNNESQHQVKVDVIDEPTVIKKDNTDQSHRGPRSRKTLQMALADTSKQLAEDSSALSDQKDIRKQKVENPNESLHIIHDESQAKKDKEQALRRRKQVIAVSRPENTPQMNQRVQNVASTNSGQTKAKAPQSTASSSPSNSTKSARNAQSQTGTYWIQVASLATEDAAVKQAKRLESKTPGNLTNTVRRTIRVDLGKPHGIKYRVQYGPYTKTSAIHRCKKLKSQDRIDCFVTK